MAFFSLPNEIIIEIAEDLDKEQDIYCLILVSRRLYSLIDKYLYCHNIKHQGSSALLWAAEHGRESTARKLLHLGADVNVKAQKATSNGSWPRPGLTPLHLAAEKGHLAIVKLLLEVGADPEARVLESLTPLFFALGARHEKVARTIARRISNLQSCSVHSTKRLTPLHVSCRLGLWTCARYFLNNGADVDATDASAMTALHHALLHSPLEPGYHFEPGPDEIFETVKVLMEFGANQNLESQPRSIWEEPTSARNCGLRHQYGRVRELFHTNESPPHNVSQIELHPLHIGRTWMLPSPSETNGAERDGLYATRYTNTEPFFNSFQSLRKFDGDQRQQVDLDLSTFPILDEANQNHMSSLKPHLSDGPWSPAKIDNLIACFSVPKEPDTPPISEGGAQVNPFPQLNSHICRSPLENEAGKLWAGLRKPKGHSVAEDAISRSASSEKKALPGGKGPKKHGKSRWQPLAI